MEPQARILKVIQKVTGKEITPGTDESLFVSGLLDSFALTDFVSGLEEEFRVTIPDSDLSARKFDTIRKVETYLANRV
ncbi:MAG: acyl carrier protein [Terracidiphilus sp.]|jgi:acyl carrier protein